MEKKIPIYFDTIILDSPVQDISIDTGMGVNNGSRLQVAVFTKYQNRNGSYITDEYANHLIETATRGYTPVVGFFDPNTQTWASHTGPELANGYGYVERFIGWQPLEDTDGVTREYAVFSVVIFSDLSSISLDAARATLSSSVVFIIYIALRRAMSLAVVISAMNFLFFL